MDIEGTEYIEIPEVGLVALNPLNENTKGIEEVVETLRQEEVVETLRQEIILIGNSRLVASPEEMHKVVTLLGKTHRQDYRLLTPEQYLAVSRYAQQNSPELTDSLINRDDILNAVILPENRGERMMHEGFRLIKQENGLWTRVGGRIVPIHDAIDYSLNERTESGVIAVCDTEKKLLEGDWRSFNRSLPIDYAGRVFIPENH